MNVLLFLGLVVFVIIALWLCYLFVTNTVETTTQKEEAKEPVYDDVLDRCMKLYEQGFHAELQRYAQRELSKNYGDVDLRRILAKSFCFISFSNLKRFMFFPIFILFSYNLLEIWAPLNEKPIPRRKSF